MTEKAQNPEKELRAILGALAESVASASDEEIRADLEHAGKKLEDLAEETRTILLDRHRLFRHRRLEAARRQYDKQRAGLDQTTVTLPHTHDERRGLLARVFEMMTDYREALLTAQHRDFMSLGDEDVASFLEQLATLGVLDEYRRRGGR